MIHLVRYYQENMYYMKIREPKVIIYDISKRPTQFKIFKGLNILSYDMLLLIFIMRYVYV